MPIFNLVPAHGEPARFGFEVDTVPIVITTHVHAGTDYAVEANVELASQAANVLSSTVTFWGVPGDIRHDSQRGWNCLVGGYFAEARDDPTGEKPPAPCEPAGQTEPEAFLTMPTSCENTPASTMNGETWPISGDLKELPKTEFLSSSFTFTSPFTGCGLLPFNPSISVEPDSHAASTPSGMTVNVHLPQEGTISGKGLAESTVKETVLALPQGVEASAGAADGLLTCTAGELGLESGFGEEAALENNHFTPTPGGCEPGQRRSGRSRSRRR